jgi:hypothetical protein
MGLQTAFPMSNVSVNSYETALAMLQPHAFSECRNSLICAGCVQCMQQIVSVLVVTMSKKLWHAWIGSSMPVAAWPAVTCGVCDAHVGRFIGA